MLRESIKKETLQTMMIFSLITVVAESETNAINEAKKRHPSLQVCYIEQKKINYYKQGYRKQKIR